MNYASVEASEWVWRKGGRSVGRWWNQAEEVNVFVSFWKFCWLKTNNAGSIRELYFCHRSVCSSLRNLGRAIFLVGATHGAVGYVSVLRVTALWQNTEKGCRIFLSSRMQSLLSADVITQSFLSPCSLSGCCFCFSHVRLIVVVFKWFSPILHCSPVLVFVYCSSNTLTDITFLYTVQG